MAIRAAAIGNYGITAAAAASLSLSSGWPVCKRGVFFRSLGSSASLESSSTSASSSSRKQLILYSKPGCCLCDGLKEKLTSAFSLSGPHALHYVDLQVRDITSNPEWEKAYQYEIPVLAKIRPDGTEEVLPRLSPRLGVELVQKKIADALS